jgi:hypothetical protein
MVVSAVDDLGPRHAWTGFGSTSRRVQRWGAFGGWRPTIRRGIFATFLQRGRAIFRRFVQARRTVLGFEILVLQHGQFWRRSQEVGVRGLVWINPLEEPAIRDRLVIQPRWRQGQTLWKRFWKVCRGIEWRGSECDRRFQTQRDRDPQCQGSVAASGGEPPIVR